MSTARARVIKTVIDVVVLSAALWLAFYVRFDWHPPLQMLKRLVFLWPYAVAFQLGVLFLFGIHRFPWRYIGLREASRILWAALVVLLALVAVRLVSAALLSSFGYAQYALIPTAVIVIDALLVFLGITGARAVMRATNERGEAGRRRASRRKDTPTVLIGAGQAGLLVAKEIAARPDLGIRAVGFLDDDAGKVGSVIHGIPVLGTTAQLVGVCGRHGVEEALVTIAKAPGTDIRRIVMACEAAGIPAKIIPGIYEIVGGMVNLARIRDVAIEDLLRREPVALDMQGISSLIQGKTILVTGAGGSIGSEICRQVARFVPAVLIMVERFENALFEIRADILQRVPTLSMQPMVADITDAGRMRSIMRRARPDVVFHSAAHKHVPMMQDNPGEAVKNNVVGTRIVTDLAAELEVENFVMISTDKAVNPSSIMGASKRLAELYVQALAQRAAKTRFVSVRFGNVLGSSGSVVPTFKKQIAAGGPVTVTHAEMSRYFMTIPEAVQLVLQAAILGRGGDVLLLDMGEPVKILDLARDLIRLSGLEPGRDIDIEIIGVRPGEKLFEELNTSEEMASRTAHEKVYVARATPAEWQSLVAGIDDLSRRADELDPTLAFAQMSQLIPELAHTASHGARVVPLARI